MPSGERRSWHDSTNKGLLREIKVDMKKELGPIDGGSQRLVLGLVLKNIYCDEVLVVETPGDLRNRVGVIKAGGDQWINGS